MSRQPQVTCCTCDLSIICVEKLSDRKTWDSFSSWSWVGDEWKWNNLNQVECCQASTRRDFRTHVLQLVQKVSSWIMFLHSNGLLCTDACTKVDCENYWDVDITDGQDGEYTSDEDDYGENWSFDGFIKLFVTVVLTRFSPVFWLY